MSACGLGSTRTYQGFHTQGCRNISGSSTVTSHLMVSPTRVNRSVTFMFTLWK
jgi:hypothetical protein